MRNSAISILTGTFLCFTTIIFAQQLNSERYNSKNDSIISSLIVHVNEDSIQSYIQSLENFGTRFMIAPNRKNVANWIKSKFILHGIENVRIDSVLCNTEIDLWNLHYDTTTWQYNVVATIPGIENPDDFFVIGAHYDDIVAPNGDPMIYSPGADDNASGVAALFEIARIFSEQNYHPKSSIEFVAFAAEELMNYGNCGSEGYINQAITNDMDIQLMINNDMIANTDGSNWQIKISNYMNCEWLTTTSVNITETYTDIEPYLLESSSTGSADCRYFYQAGIPCVYFMEKDFNEFYHSVNDLVANCEMDYCSEAIKISLGVLVTTDNPLTVIAELDQGIPIKIFPNPFQDIVNFHISNNIRSVVEIKIFSISGKLINHQLHITSPQSEKHFSWNGKNASGKVVAKGMYFINIAFDDKIIRKKIIKH